MQHEDCALELQNLERHFAHGRVRAVDGVSLTVEPGEILSILGPSGCGKTTLMRMIAGLEVPTSGQIRIHGRDVSSLAPHERNVGLVFQSLAVFPHMNVEKNVGFGLRMRKLSAAAIKSKVDTVLDLVQLPPDQFASRWPSELSGGQLQRVALARTLVTEPALVLFDEPMAALDRRLRDYMAIELRAIQKQLGIAAVYVTHDQETASTMSDRIAVMNSGRVVQVGPPPEIYNRPANRFVAEFLGDTNVLTIARLHERSGVAQQVEVEAGQRLAVSADDHLAGGQMVLFRPGQTKVFTDDPGGAMQAVLTSVSFNGGLYHWMMRLADGTPLLAQSTRDDLGGVSSGQPIWVSVDHEQTHVVEQ
ncbi:ABC transporter ATP-binding protein [Pseudohoeflea coraliihabitans]|uniref:ABC transporter ATP-binding protein n=1 Tax=Pseudohoeflea coraliihabitans TaxID=2860393 RepID=A0ABS6WMB6_9HYPH|nr:ABC transporter ATP-binding protein [Pseudohoeflea sp. DP4N28-3]MBW3096255.1 ABC transporter ATP-binding protein [Pseudohoeflea sp. DP4N28-3]